MNCLIGTCKEVLPNGAKFCPKCGCSVDGKFKGMILIPCKHCKATGECKTNKAAGLKYSCETCRKAWEKKETTLDEAFAVVSCSFCGGAGYRVIKIQAESNNKDKPQGNPHKSGGNKHVNR